MSPKMDATTRLLAMGLLGHFNDEMTRVVDEAFGTRWAEIEDILAIAVIVSGASPTTRALADIAKLDRRATSRMVSRLQAEGLVSTRPSPTDRRAVQVLLTAHGNRQAKELRASIAAFFVQSAPIATQISEGLGFASPTSELENSADAFDLLRRVCEAGVALVRVMPDSVTEGQLAARQRAALVQIAMQPGARPNDLVSSLEVSRAGVAYIVDQLCSKGFVTRHRGAVPGDRRAVTLEATANGLQAVHDAMDGIEQQRESLAALFAEVAAWSPSRAAAERPLMPANREE
ncbi:MarR family transcriptional regulator [Microbacterium sp. AZCO]|uniref:MarR family winged helix-turn-helix transcriptional regulator n=1 Tax=Microbacterium sp. AZCO TaxID=3142976 RepID=UPI0031F366DA